MVDLNLDWVEGMRILILLVLVLLSICVCIYESNARKKDIQRGFERLEHEIEKQNKDADK
ncbi:hypothetical protein [Lachnospira multipara]|uniref:Uncharacterized protein n=1 Tax=Lachnospira multipara TaxID=28051 RepID=A0A1H5VUB0_9FIRM|nr:hypothetical protein [Lachnospira multipara]SEF90895.1 hypothetical protein SAMN05216537_112106 [Lachnospira multipara]